MGLGCHFCCSPGFGLEIRKNLGIPFSALLGPILLFSSMFDWDLHVRVDPLETVGNRTLMLKLKRLLLLKNILLCRVVGCHEQFLLLVSNWAQNVTSYEFLKTYVERVL